MTGPPRRPRLRSPALRVVCRRRLRRRLGRAAALPALLTLLAATAGFAQAAPARTSLPVIERQVMCVTCKIPLNVAESAQADRERAFIQSLIAAGDSEAQVKRALVAQYGRTVLALPSSGGFGAFAYAVPIAVVLGLVAALIVLLPRWRARSATPDAAPPARAPLSAKDSARLDADMARFD